ncbi:CPK2 [Symbiodinium sp. CCMP2592]|nr:CPK2 [Symbiodinium sp. CCMP2592]
MPIGHDAEIKSVSTKPGYQRRKTLPAVVSSKSEALAKTLATQRRMTISAAAPRNWGRPQEPDKFSSRGCHIRQSSDDQGSQKGDDWSEDTLGEFEREFRRLAGLPPRMPTPPKWVPPWCRNGARPHLAPVVPSADALPRSPMLSRLGPVEETAMLSNVLSTLLPVPPSKHSRLPRLAHEQDAASVPISPGSPFSSASNVVSEDEDRERSEVLAFCSSLVRRFGNTTRAFRAMKRAVQVAHGTCARKASSSQALEPLSKSEFEWCVTSLMRHGNRHLASRLFAVLETGNGSIPVCSFSRNMDWVEDLLSLFQVRQNLLDRFGSFAEIEEALRWAACPAINVETLQSCSNSLQRPPACSVSRREFVAAVSSLGVTASQAVHLFFLLDHVGKGSIELPQFIHALEEIPSELAWRDLRQRLLLRNGSMAEALRSVTNPDLSESELGRYVARCEIPDFQLGEGNTRSLLESFLRVAAPAIRLQDFWQRVASEWPQVLEASAAAAAAGRRRGKEKFNVEDQKDATAEATPTPLQALQRLEALLAELLPEFQAFPVPHASTLDSQALVLPYLSFEMFDCLAEHVDVSQENAIELFRCIASSAAALDRKTGEALELGQLAATSIFVEDFAEQLTMWSAFEPKGSKRVRAAERVRQVVAPVRAAISALKAELTTASTAVPSHSEETSEPPFLEPPRSKVRRRSQLPWCAYYRCRPAGPV